MKGWFGGKQYMYTVKYVTHGTATQHTDLTLERAIVYKKRMRRRGVIVTIEDQNNTSNACKDGVCSYSWKPNKPATA